MIILKSVLKFEKDNKAQQAAYARLFSGGKTKAFLINENPQWSRDNCIIEM